MSYPKASLMRSASCEPGGDTSDDATLCPERVASGDRG